MADRPMRVQRRRARGWQMPENTVYVGRPTLFGNPFKAADAKEAGFHDGKRAAAWAYQEWLEGSADFADQDPGHRSIVRNLLPDLRGKNLACWCRLCPEHRDGKPFGVKCDACEPCHADVLGEMVCT